MTVAENIEAHLDIKTACDYLNFAREPLNQTNIVQDQLS